MTPSDARGGRAAAVVASLRGLGQVSASSWRLVALPLGALVCQSVVLQLAQFEILARREHDAFGAPDATSALGVVAQQAAPLLLPLLVGLLVVLRLRTGGRFAPGTRACVAGAAAVALLVGMRFLLPAPPAWLTLGFVRTLRADLVLLALLAAAFLVLLDRARGRLRAVGVVALHATALVLMVLGSLEFGYFVVTGSLADAFLLRYALANASDVSWVLGPELRGPKLLLLLAPFAVPLLAIVTRRRGAAASGPAPGIGWLLLPVVFLAILPAAPASSSTRLGGSTYLGLLADLVGTPLWERGVEGGEAPAGPLFDTRGLRFATTAATRRLNVVVLVLESQRSPGRLPPHVTPFLDALAARALVVDRMYAVVPHTNRALVPILCGIEPRLTQGYASAVPGMCLPALLRPHGYASAFFTSATLAFEHKGELLAAMGFDERRGADDLARDGYEKINYFGYEERALLAPMLEWAERRHRDGQPFLMTALTLTTHHPYGVARAFPHRALAPGHPSLDRYLNGLGYVDAFLAELLAGFEARGLADSTLFVLVGDHGQAFGEHGLQFHSGVIWDEALQVPALLVGPRAVIEPRHVAGPRSHTDLLPTVAELLGFALEGGTLSGTSLLQAVAADRTLHHATWIDNQSMALRRGARKYVYHYRRLPLEVYDLARDPLERMNLAPELSPEEVEGVELELLRWRRRVNERYG